jgi:spermidine/putrescine transport system substrate-binding protein
MTFHPREGWNAGRRIAPWERPMSRRRMIRLSASAVITAQLLAACGDSSEGSAGSGGGVKIGTPENPVEQPLFDDNPGIESDLEPEDGPLKLYNWADYLWPRIMKDFSEETGVEVELTTFYNMEEATRKLRTGDLQFDVFFPTAEVVPKFVAGRVLQPLNHDYLPNLSANVWPNLQDPYFDVGSRYTVPYTVYETGIAWRADMVDADIESMENPWDAFWDPQFDGIAGLYDDYRETIGVGLYRTGNNDINTGDQAALDAARDALMELVDLVNVRYTIDGAYSGMPEGKFGIHHSWSGDVVGAQYYFPKGGDPSVLRFLWPPKSESSTAGGYISNDSLAIPSNAESPVLAHMFLNYLLDEKVALKNFGWLGYQPPLNGILPDKLVSQGYVPENVASAIISKEDFSMGQIPVQLAPEVDSLWLDAWSQVQSG